MNLEQAIQERWAASDALSVLLAAEHVRTGRSFAGRAPCATITRRKVRTVFRTNAGDGLDEVTLRASVWHDDYEAGRAIVDQLKATFDRADFPLAGDDRVVQMRRADERVSRHDDGVWQFTIEFLVQVHLPCGV